MTDLPKEDRDLIERVLGYVPDPPYHRAEVQCCWDEIFVLLAAARSEGPARAPVVDEEMVERGAKALATTYGELFEPGVYRIEARAVLLAALGASQ